MIYDPLQCFFFFCADTLWLFLFASNDEYTSAYLKGEKTLNLLFHKHTKNTK